jgi:hypothetical protein
MVKGIILFFLFSIVNIETYYIKQGLRLCCASIRFVRAISCTIEQNIYFCINIIILLYLITFNLIFIYYYMINKKEKTLFLLYFVNSLLEFELSHCTYK